MLKSNISIKKQSSENAIVYIGLPDALIASLTPFGIVI